MNASIERKLTPIAAPFTPEVEEILRNFPKRDGYVLSLFRVFARSPRALAKLGAGGLLDRESPLEPREREIAILRVTGLCRCEYEWGVHVTAFADWAGLSAEEVKRTVLGAADQASWEGREALLVGVLDQLHDTARLREETRSRFDRQWSAEEQLEILALSGFYHTVSYVANTAGLELEPWAARFPAGTPGGAEMTPSSLGAATPDSEPRGVSNEGDPSWIVT